MSLPGASMVEANVSRDGEAVRLPWRVAGILPGISARAFDRLCAAVFVLFILALAALAIVLPEREWDMTAYVALTIEDQHETPEALHAATWEIVRQNTTEKEFTLLTTAGDYRQAQFADAGNFVSQLTMYRLKVGYVALLKALAPALGPVGAIQAVNAAATLLLGACLFFWLRRWNLMEGALFLMPVMLLSSVISLARLGAPDMVVAALTVAGVLLLTGRRPWASVPVVVAAFLVRPDTLIFLFALVLASLAFGWRRLPALAAFLVSAALTFPLSSGADHIGWWPHFWFSTVEMQDNLTGFDPAFSVAAYVKGIARGLAISVISHRWLALAALLLLGAWFVLRDRQDVPREVAMPMLATVLAVGGKFVVFPLPDDRIYAVFLWIFALCLLALWRPRLVRDRIH